MRSADGADADLFPLSARFRRNNTLYGCAQFCDSNGYNIMGVYGERCRCGSSMPGTVPLPDTDSAAAAGATVERRHLDDASCAGSCPDNTEVHACGNGGWYQDAPTAVYEIADIVAAAGAGPADCDWFKDIGVYQGPGLSYLGCFEDAHGWMGDGGIYSQPVARDGTVGWHGPATAVGGGGQRGPQTEGAWQNRDNTVEPMYIELCAQLCTGSQYMSIFDGSECYCGDSPPPQSQRDAERGCNDPCPGDPTQLCGDGGNRKHSQIYKITDIAAVGPNSCHGLTPPRAIIFGNQAGMTGFSDGGGFAGSIADIQLFSTALDQDDADCLFRSGESTVAICLPASDMSGLHYFQSFMPAEPDMDATVYFGDWDGRGTPAALASCAAACQDINMAYAGLEWAVCSCGNSFGSAGRAEPAMCGTDTQPCGGTVCDGEGDGPCHCDPCPTLCANPPVPTCGTTPQSMDDMFNAIGSSASGSSAIPACIGVNAVYQVGSTSGNRGYISRGIDEYEYKGCYRMGNMRPPGVTLYGNAFFDDSAASASSSSGGYNQVFMGGGGGGGGGSGDSLNNGGRDFGIHFDGEGDFAEIIGSEAGYAVDGSFSISLWATRPDCHVYGSEEWLYAHTKYPNDPSNLDASLIQPGIALAYVCTENGEHSTAAAPERGALHLVRVYLNDDEGVCVTFDIPLNSAAQDLSGGFVTREWVHIAIGVGTPTGCTKNSCTDDNADCCASSNPCSGTRCDGQGDGPCGCDPCAACGDPDVGTPAGPAFEQQTCSGGLEARPSGDGMCFGPYGGEQQDGAYECCASENATGSVYAFIDGKRVDSSLLGVPPQHDLIGTRYIGCSMITASDGTQTPDPTCEPTCDDADRGCDSTLVAQIGGPTAVLACSQLCTGAGYSLSALTYSRTCQVRHAHADTPLTTRPSSSMHWFDPSFLCAVSVRQQSGISSQRGR